VLGLVIFSQILGQGKDITGDVSKKTRQQIEQILLEGNKDVTIPHEFATTSKDDTTVFGMGILSDTAVCSSAAYVVTVDFAKAVDAANEDMTETINPVMGAWYIEEPFTYTIKNNERRVVSIPIRADAQGARKGWTYVFNVQVQCKAGAIYGSLQKIYVIVD